MVVHSKPPTMAKQILTQDNLNSKDLILGVSLLSRFSAGTLLGYQLQAPQS